MSPDNDPIPALKRDAVAHLAEFLRYGNGDDLASLLGTDRFRIADLRRGRLARFSLETLLRFLVRAGMHVELRVERVPSRSRPTLGRSRTRRRQRPRRPGVWSASRGNTAGLCRQYCTGRAEDLGRLGRVTTSRALAAQFHRVGHERSIVRRRERRSGGSEVSNPEVANRCFALSRRLGTGDENADAAHVGESI